MATTIPNLWPEQINVDVQTPFTILQVQANLLGKVTKGILEGTVETERSADKVQHRLVVIAPAYNAYRHTLLTALHDADMPYPAEVRAEALARKEKNEPHPMTAALGPTYHTVYPIAHSDEQMLQLVQQALRSEATKAALLSLIAKSNEARAATAQPSNGADQGNGPSPSKTDEKSSA